MGKKGNSTGSKIAKAFGWAVVIAATLATLGLLVPGHLSLLAVFVCESDQYAEMREVPSARTPGERTPISFCCVEKDVCVERTLSFAGAAFVVHSLPAFALMLFPTFRRKRRGRGSSKRGR